MTTPRKPAGRKRRPSKVVSTRIAPELLARLDWLVRNDDETEERTDGLRKALYTYIEAREAACRKKGLTPLT